MIDVATLGEPNVSFFVARNGGAIIGCAALVEADDGTAEIKWMFVDPQARDLKAASRLMNVLEDSAKARGLVAIRLETGIRQPEAIGLYRKGGYVEIEPRALRFLQAGPLQPVHGEDFLLLVTRLSRWCAPMPLECSTEELPPVSNVVRCTPARGDRTQDEITAERKIQRAREQNFLGGARPRSRGRVAVRDPHVDDDGALGARILHGAPSTVSPIAGEHPAAHLSG